MHLGREVTALRRSLWRDHTSRALTSGMKDGGSEGRETPQAEKTHGSKGTNTGITWEVNVNIERYFGSEGVVCRDVDLTESAPV